MDLSQDNFSDFLKNPFSFPPAITTDDAYIQIYQVFARTTKNQLPCFVRFANKLAVKAASSTDPTIIKCTEWPAWMKPSRPGTSISTKSYAALCWKNVTNWINIWMNWLFLVTSFDTSKMAYKNWQKWSSVRCYKGWKAVQAANSPFFITKWQTCNATFKESTLWEINFSNSPI